MSTPVCEREHRYDIRLSDLPDNQGSDYRHKCCGCAYDWGFNDGFGVGQITIE